MKNLLPLLLLASLCAVSVSAQSGRRNANPTPVAPIQPDLNPEPEPARRIPVTELLFLPEVALDTEIKGFDHTTFRLADFHGKVMVLNLWASWCGPCKREVPEYERVRKEFADRDVVFIALTAENPETSGEKVQKFLAEVKFGFRLGWASRELASYLMNGKGGIPQTMVIDSTGRVLKHWTGYAFRQSGARLRTLINEALKETP